MKLKLKLNYSITYLQNDLTYLTIEGKFNRNELPNKTIELLLKKFPDVSEGKEYPEVLIISTFLLIVVRDMPTTLSRVQEWLRTVENTICEMNDKVIGGNKLIEALPSEAYFDLVQDQEG